MRRRRLIVRTLVLVLLIGAAVGLVLEMSSGGFGIGLALMVMVCAVLAVVEAATLVAAVRDRTASGPPPGHMWWMCELPVDHRFVLTRESTAEHPTWRCRRCGLERHTQPPRSIGDSIGSAETSWLQRGDDR